MAAQPETSNVTPAAQSAVEISFDQEPSGSELEEVRDLLGDDAQVVGTDDDTTVHAAQSFEPVGYDKLACGTSNSWSDSNGEYTLQHKCGGSTAPWGYRLSSKMRSIAASTVKETGMAWWHNGTKKPTQSPHNVSASYQFHGTYNPVKKNYYIRYQDEFYFRHNIGGGGDVHITIKGKWYFYNG
ncbi:MAG: hypothetical protein PGN15_05500 [Aeromicrobium erythreum]